MGIKVLVVDDSAVVRQMLSEILLNDRDIDEVVTAQDPYVAASRLKQFVPDVITLDVEMPRMDGLSFLQKLMSQHPIPVVMCSSLTETNSATALKAIEYGAVDIIQKPRMDTKKFLDESRVVICDAVKAASRVKVRRQSRQTTINADKKMNADVILAKAGSRAMIQTTETIIVVGASTGGTEALRIFVEMLPADFPGVVIVQHMPEHFTTSFAERLNSLSKMTVKEAGDGDTVIPGRVLLAPGNKHILLQRSGARYYVQIKEGPLVSRHRPSVDVLFRSAARYAGKNAVGVIMTGMGDDGAKGMMEMKEAGASTIAQDEKSCVVFGMPKVAIELGGVDQVLPLNKIAQAVAALCY
ncbi:MAG: chemotaxis response regulator protein-glutamate methylesterase [Desulforhopalus sp.]